MITTQKKEPNQFFSFYANSIKEWPMVGGARATQKKERLAAGKTTHTRVRRDQISKGDLAIGGSGAVAAIAGIGLLKSLNKSTM